MSKPDEITQAVKHLREEAEHRFKAGERGRAADLQASAAAVEAFYQQLRRMLIEEGQKRGMEIPPSLLS